METCAQGPEWQSDTVTAIMVPEGFDANDVIKAAYYKYDLSLGAGLSKVAGKVFRIGHLGWMNELMVLSSLGGAELAMRDAGLPFVAGAGVGAAVDYFAESSAIEAKIAAE
jgi:alanine-glyoxylate transaminase/serine-glyoxylate transaminase/serine-pyruvate transaminase